MNEVKLKPCPFCGGKAKAFGVYGNYGVMCKECDAVIANAGTDDDAAKAWNERTWCQTYLEYFEEQFPRADVESIIDALCPGQIFGEINDPLDCDGTHCRDCWDREMP